MHDQQHQQPTRRGFLRNASALTIAAAAASPGLAPNSARAAAATQESSEAPSDGPCYKVSLNAYSFSKLLNDFNKQRGGGISLMQLLDFCAKQGFDGIDPTGYFFPTYPAVPPDDFVNDLKRKAFGLGLGI